jgi:hypothetical protein
MLPVDYRLDANVTNNEATLRLYKSGSIQAFVTASSLGDDVLLDSTYEAERRASSGDAFNEENLFEIGRNTESFFATGSSIYIGQEPGVFSQPLSEKTQIRMSFPVNRPVKMLPNSSSIYYFNRDLTQWNIPAASVNDHVGPFDKLRWYQGGIGRQSNYIEDHKGFNAFGLPIFSGSRSMRFSTSDVPSAERGNYGSEYFVGGTVGNTLGANRGISEMVELCSKDYASSLQRSRLYNASNSEKFSLPIDSPFLIESVVVEIPFSAGEGWMRDMTTFGPTEMYANDATKFSSLSLQDGGPVITMGLISQKNYGTSSIRDLIASEIITHNNDYGVRKFRFTSGSLEPIWNYYPRISTIGLGSNYNFTSNPTVISSSNYSYSGTAVVKMCPEISNGVHAAVSAQSPLYMLGRDAFGSLLNMEYVQNKNFVNLLGTSSLTQVGVTYLGVDPFGRGMTGFSPSGGSIFGREHAFQTTSESNSSRLKNGMYTTNSLEVEAAKDVLTLAHKSTLSVANPSQRIIYLYFYTYLGSRVQSPYLVNPGDSLSLFLAKTRPATSIFTGSAIPWGSSNTTGAGTLTSSSYVQYLNDPLGHNVTLETGSINITFYGSYVQGNRGYNP